jgi:SAM-dependent methyltransferase
MAWLEFFSKLVRGAIRRVRGQNSPRDLDVSTDYVLLQGETAEDPKGWFSPSVAQRQHDTFAPLLQEAREGNPRLDFVVAARAVEGTGLSDPLLLEVGCGSAYYAEVLSLLLARPLRYIGLDYAQSMIRTARRIYPGILLAAGDACRLPLKSNCCDILLSGTSLMHIADYGKAVRESARVTRLWGIFHTVPVMAQRSTTLLRKIAYGEPVVEVIFNRSHLESLIVDSGFRIVSTYESIPYDVSAVVGETTRTVTYLCKKDHGGSHHP